MHEVKPSAIMPIGSAITPELYWNSYDYLMVAMLGWQAYLIYIVYQGHSKRSGWSGFGLTAIIISMEDTRIACTLSRCFVSLHVVHSINIFY